MCGDVSKPGIPVRCASHRLTQHQATRFTIARNCLSTIEAVLANYLRAQASAGANHPGEITILRGKTERGPTVSALFCFKRSSAALT
jgi:hypothetical protein